METNCAFFFTAKYQQLQKMDWFQFICVLPLTAQDLNKVRNGILPYPNGVLMQVKQKEIPKKQEQ